MIKVLTEKENNRIKRVLIKGHANYDKYGQDIVCAAVSAMTITTVNAIASLEETIKYTSKEGYVEIIVTKMTDVNETLLNNLLIELEELKNQYPKNIEIRNEE